MQAVKWHLSYPGSDHTIGSFPHQMMAKPTNTGGIMELVLLWLILGFASAIVASSKNRSFFGWLIAGFLFGPIALFMVGVMPSIGGGK